MDTVRNVDSGKINSRIRIFYFTIYDADWQQQRILLQKLTQIDTTSSASIANEQKLARLLREFDVPVLYPVELGFIFNDQPIQIYEYVKVNRMDPTNPYYWYQVGEILKRLHEISSSELNQLIPNNLMLIDLWQEELQRIREHVPFFYKRYAQTLSERITNLLISCNLMPGIIYGRSTIPILVSESGQAYLLNCKQIHVGFPSLEALAVRFKAGFYGPLCEEAFTNGYGSEKIIQFGNLVDNEVQSLNHITSIVQNWNDLFDDVHIQNLNQVWELDPSFEKEYHFIRSDLQKLSCINEKDTIRFYVNKQTNQYTDSSQEFNPLQTSIIIPCKDRHDLFHFTLKSLEANLELQKFKKYIELILVDDNSEIRVSDFMKDEKFTLNATIVRNENNFGVSVARNIGALNASGELLIFIDNDCILGNTQFLTKHWIAHHSQNVLGVGLFHKIFENDLLTQPEKYLAKETPKLFNDYRCANFDQKSKIFPLLHGTNNFKDLGFGNKGLHWTLPFLVAGREMSLKKENLIKADGFDHYFRGWGVEENHFAAKLISIGCYIKPLYPVSFYSLVHPPREGTEMTRANSYCKNRLLYEVLLDKAMNNLNSNENLKKASELNWSIECKINY